VNKNISAYFLVLFILIFFAFFFWKKVEMTDGDIFGLCFKSRPFLMTASLILALVVIGVVRVFGF
jgi:hypothetical protein